MIPFCWDEISSRSDGTDFILGLHGKISFHPGKAGELSNWYLFPKSQIPIDLKT